MKERPVAADAAGLFLLAASTLALEVALTRVFALSQGYHFAFVAVGVALLGSGASGSALALLGPVAQGWSHLRWASALLFGASVAGSYALAGWLPFDSYRLATDAGQVPLAGLTYVALTLPFFWSGLAVSLTLAARPGGAGPLYAANLAGSAAGCLLPLGLLPLFGTGGSVLLAGALGAAAAIGFAPSRTLRAQGGAVGLALALLVLLAPSGALEPRLSPYRGLSQALNLPGAVVVWQRANAFSRVDLVLAPALRSAPGLSLSFQGELPGQMASAIDGDSLRAISLARPSEASYLDYTPAAVAHVLRPGAQTLVLEGSAADLALALRAGGSVVAVQGNPLLLQATEEAYSWAGVGWSPGRDPRVELVASAPRAYLARSSRRFDVVHLGLAAGFRPVSAGAFSLTEDYVHTLEAFREYFRHLAPGGLLVATRWLQVPPSEDLRFLNLAVRALEAAGAAHPDRQVAVLRDYQTLTLLAKAGELMPAEVASIVAFADSRAYDVVYAPGVAASAANRYHVLPGAEHREGFLQVLSPEAGRRLVETYPYDLRPPTDDRPFIGHLFRWQQAPAVLAALGKTWQPFGGAGYLLVVGLLALAIVAGAALTALPLLLRPPARMSATGPSLAWTLAYFAALGVGYLAVEVPSMQRLILLLDQPTYAIAVVLASLLLWSGLGSLLSGRLVARLGGRALLGALTAVLLAYWLGLGPAAEAILPLALAPRLVAVAGLLAPAGFLMGVPFASGIRALGGEPGLVPWAWAANAFASVVCSVLAAMLALEAGYSAVLGGAVLAYAAATIAWPGGRRVSAGASEGRTAPLPGSCS